MRVPPYFQRRLADPESLLLYTKGAKTLSETGSGFAAVVLIKNAFCFVSSLGWLRNCFKGLQADFCLHNMEGVFLCLQKILASTLEPQTPLFI